MVGFHTRFVREGNRKKGGDAEICSGFGAYFKVCSFLAFSPTSVYGDLCGGTLGRRGGRFEEPCKARAKGLISRALQVDAGTVPVRGGFEVWKCVWSTIVAPVNDSQFLFLSLSLVVSGVHALIVEEAATHSLMAIEV